MTEAELTSLATTMAQINLDRVQQPQAEPTKAAVAEWYFQCRQANRDYRQARGGRHSDRLQRWLPPAPLVLDGNSWEMQIVSGGNRSPWAATGGSPQAKKTSPRCEGPLPTTEKPQCR